MRIVKLVALLVLTCTGVSPQRLPQDSPLRDLERLQSLGTSRIPEFRRQIRPFLNEREKLIEASITYSILATEAVNGQAVNSDGNGKRKILIGAGWLRTIEWLSISNLIPRWSTKECAIEYQRHVISGVITNGASPQTARVFEPFTYALRHREICPDVRYSAFENDDAAQQLQKAMVGASFRWLLAHELGHHINNHRATNDEESRRNEEQADDFAFRVASADPSSIVLALPAYLLAIGLGSDVEGEAKSTHPAGARRFQAFAGALKSLPNRDPEVKRYLDDNGLMGRWNQIVTQMIQEITKALRN
ncbi:MAG: hypothetical protein JNJ50_24005 [Acidobacteria bacterium]|nr:hypothetical protein [Acidobacteriota bacterium]